MSFVVWCRGQKNALNKRVAIERWYSGEGQVLAFTAAPQARCQKRLRSQPARCRTAEPLLSRGILGTADRRMCSGKSPNGCQRCAVAHQSPFLYTMLCSHLGGWQTPPAARTASRPGRWGYERANDNQAVALCRAPQHYSKPALRRIGRDDPSLRD